MFASIQLLLFVPLCVITAAREDVHAISSPMEAGPKISDLKSFSNKTDEEKMKFFLETVKLIAEVTSGLGIGGPPMALASVALGLVIDQYDDKDKEDPVTNTDLKNEISNTFYYTKEVIDVIDQYDDKDKEDPVTNTDLKNEISNTFYYTKEVIDGSTSKLECAIQSETYKTYHGFAEEWSGRIATLFKDNKIGYNDIEVQCTTSEHSQQLRLLSKYYTGAGNFLETCVKAHNYDLLTMNSLRNLIKFDAYITALQSITCCCVHAQRKNERCDPARCRAAYDIDGHLKEIENEYTKLAVLQRQHVMEGISTFAASFLLRKVITTLNAEEALNMFLKEFTHRFMNTGSDDYYTVYFYSKEYVVDYSYKSLNHSNVVIISDHPRFTVIISRTDYKEGQKRLSWLENNYQKMSVNEVRETKNFDNLDLTMDYVATRVQRLYQSGVNGTPLPFMATAVAAMDRTNFATSDANAIFQKFYCPIKAKKLKDHDYRCTLMISLGL
uniref:SERPIN domain-containing protein n=1 Tax=Steinernema glaseri TaxID=37863 RepID=A0A1I7Z879_9BILA